METNNFIEKITGTLTDIQQAETLLLNQEVGAIECTVDTDAGPIVLLALDTDGTAYWTLQNDPRFRKGVRVIAFRKGARCVALRLDTPNQHGKLLETDIGRLKDKAMQSLAMPKGELYALLNAFDADSIQAFAIALYLKQQGERTERVLEIADKDALCSDCKSTLHVSPRRAYAFSDTFCQKCSANVTFTLAEPIPGEIPTEPPRSLEEILAKLQKKFKG